MHRKLMYTVCILTTISVGSGCLSISYNVPINTHLTKRDSGARPKIAVKLDRYTACLFPNNAIRKAFEDSGYQLDSDAITKVSISHSTEVGSAFQYWGQISGAVLFIIPAYIPAKKVFTAIVATTTVSVSTHYDTILWFYFFPLYPFYEMSQQKYLYDTSLEIIRRLQQENAIPIPQ